MPFSAACFVRQREQLAVDAIGHDVAVGLQFALLVTRRAFMLNSSTGAGRYAASTREQGFT